MRNLGESGLKMSRRNLNEITLSSSSGFNSPSFFFLKVVVPNVLYAGEWERRKGMGNQKLNNQDVDYSGQEE